MKDQTAIRRILTMTDDQITAEFAEVVFASWTVEEQMRLVVMANVSML